MARLTQAQKLEQDNELVALEFFETTLSELPDPRRPQGVRYPLRSVVVIALMATVCGCDDAEAMQLWGEHNADWLAGFLDLPHGAPTQDVFLSVLGALDPEAFSAVFRSRPVTEVFEEIDKGHGRVEKRTTTICRDQTWITTAERWPSLSLLVQVTRERTIMATGKTSVEKAYYIGSDPEASAATAGHIIRRHWSIENELHWVLDMAFREDEARHRARNTAQNMTTLRHFALNLVKADKTRKVGVATARKRAGWDRKYLIELLTSAE